MTKKPETDMRDEYDFSGGVRGKYVSRIAEGSNVVVLDPYVATEFPDSECVNGVTGRSCQRRDSSLRSE